MATTTWNCGRTIPTFSHYLRRSSLVSMVKSTDLWNLNNPARLVRLNCPTFWCVLIQGQVRPGFVIIAEIIFEQSAQLIVIKDDHMIQALATNASVLLRFPLCGAEARAGSSHSDKPQKVDAFASESPDALLPESLDDLRRNGWMTSIGISG